MNIKKDEKYPKEQINKIIERLDSRKGDDEKYKKLITEGDNYFSLKAYKDAKTIFAQAAKMRPDEIYPKEMLDKIDKLMQTTESNNEAEFKNAIDKGDKEYKDEKYNDAINDYKEALNIKPKEKYPKQQIEKINKILNERNAYEENYKKLVSEGDKLFEDKSYTEARTKFEQANKLRPDEAPRKEMLEKIDKIALQTQQELDNAYNKAISDGDNNMKDNKYQEAIPNTNLL